MGCGSCGTGGGCGAGCGGNGGCGAKKRAGTVACPSMHAYDWLSDFGIQSVAQTYEVVEVLFKGGRKEFFRIPPDCQDVLTGDYVIVEVDRGQDFGTIHMMGEMVRLRVKSKGFEDISVLPSVIRKAELKDIAQWESCRTDDAEAFVVGRKAINRLRLPMKLVDTEWQYDRNKIIFYFTADHRVDFRQLVRELARVFRTRIELRQIGARDEAARLGGIGSCGRELCCSTWLQEFKPVSTQAAKMQNLPLNPLRLSGQCGRLKCCLNYELEQYMAALKSFPAVDTPVETDRGKGSVQKLDIFKNMVWVQYEDNGWEDFTVDQVQGYIVQRKAFSKGKPGQRPGKRPPSEN